MIFTRLYLAQRVQSSLLGNLMANFIYSDPDGLYSVNVVIRTKMCSQVDDSSISTPW